MEWPAGHLQPEPIELLNNSFVHFICFTWAVRCQNFHHMTLSEVSQVSWSKLAHKQNKHPLGVFILFMTVGIWNRMTWQVNSPSNAWDRLQVPFASASKWPTHYIIKASVRKNCLQQWPELDRIPGDQLGVMQNMPDGPVPCQSKPKHPHLTQSQSIRAQISQETTM